MSKVRAKFTVANKSLTVDGATITLTPVTTGSEENKEFYKWTPGGQISLSTINLDAAEQFEPGKYYYVDFIKADD